MAQFGRRSKKKKDEEKVKLTKDSYRKAGHLFKYLRPFYGWLSLGTLFLLLTTGVSLIFPMLMGSLVDAGTTETGEAVAETFNTTQLLKEAFASEDSSAINLLAIALMILFAANAIFSFGRVYLFNYITEKVLMALRQDTYSHLVRQPMNFFNQQRVGELNSRISADIATLSGAMTTTVAEFLRQVLVIVGIIVILMLISWELTLAMLISLPVVAIVGVVFGRFIKKLSKRTQDSIADSNVIAEETFTGINVVKAFANEAAEIFRYRTKTEEVRKIAMKGALWRGLFISFIIFTVFGAIVFIIWYGAQLKAEGTISLSELVSFVLYSVMIGASIGGLPDMWAGIQKAIGATESLMDWLEKEPEPISPEQDDYPKLKLEGALSLQNVSFSYSTREDVQVLKDISFEIKPGEQIAVVGPSGSGKSTLASLLMRFYSPTSGTIQIDGKAAESFNLTGLRKQIGMVPQEVLLFGGTIHENIAYGRPGATDEEIKEAARKANAHDFISGFPEGYETVVGERGIQLSGGQRQRVAIARAILKDPGILILDEATSSLDSESERLVQDALETLMEGRTSVVIAHRLSTIRHANRILVIQDGELREQGTHDELMLIEDGTYRHLTNLQLEGSDTIRS